MAISDRLPQSSSKDGRATDSCFALIGAHQRGVLMVAGSLVATQIGLRAPPHQRRPSSASTKPVCMQLKKVYKAIKLLLLLLCTYMFKISLVITTVILRDLVQTKTRSTATCVATRTTYGNLCTRTTLLFTTHYILQPASGPALDWTTSSTS